MSKEYLEAWNFIKDQMSNFTFSHLVTEMAKNTDIVDNALNRLESIDNANPSEALESLESIEADLTGLPKHVTEYDDGFDSYLEDIWNNIDTIKQALLNAQEPKQYLKWEDLEFSFKDKYMKVKLNGNIYTLRYTRNALMGFPVAYLEFDNTEITIIDCKKQFFNDLHLEVVE